MKNKKGYTLTEILIVLSILGIVGGIATISYKGYNLSVNKRDLKLHGELFASAVKNCISNYGAWKIKNSPLPGATDIYPCKVPEGLHHNNIFIKSFTQKNFILKARGVFVWARHLLEGPISFVLFE